MKVAVLKGGWSAEREVSLVSGAAVAKALGQLGHQVTELVATPDIARDLTDLKPDVVFNALHGRWGEDGCVQGILETLRIPYTHSGVKASALAMDKVLSKKLFATIGLHCAEDKIVSLKELKEDPLPRPYVVKPYNEGSSVGVTIVHEGDNFNPESLPKNLEDQQLMVERYIPGRELTVSVVGDHALCVTELRPRAGFYDYAAKYQAGMTDHLIPAPLEDDLSESIMDMALQAHNILGCRGVSRSDFRYDGEHVYILETNTQPGMTPLSLVPEQALHMGMNFNDLVGWMVEDASCDR